MSGPALIDSAAPLLAAYPQLADAVQPRAVRVVGDPIDCARNQSAFPRFDDARWRERLVDAPHPRCVATIGVGGCIASIGDGTAIYIDPTIEPEDGDLVTVAASSRAMRKLLDDGALAKAWREEYDGQLLPNLWTKQLYTHDGHRYGLADDGAIALFDSRILGVVVHVRPPLAPRRVSLEELQAVLR